MRNFLNLSVLDVYSVRNIFCHLRDFVIHNYIDIFCMSETWLYDDDSGFIIALTPELHVLHHVPRPNKKGCGVGCLINKSLQSKKHPTKSFKSFECMEVQLSNERKKVRLNIICRPLQGNFSLFLLEIESYLRE